MTLEDQNQTTKKAAAADASCHADSAADGQQNKALHTAASQSHDIPSFEEFYEEIYNKVLHTGKDEGISMHTLAAYLMVDMRAARRVISDMRKKGYLICGDKYGYYKPADNSEAFKQYKAMHKRAMSALTSLKALNRTLKGNGITLPEDQLLRPDQGGGVPDQDETEVQ